MLYTCLTRFLIRRRVLDTVKAFSVGNELKHGSGVN